MTTDRRALVVRGGWEGHQPIETTDRFVPFLRDNGFAVEVSDDLADYADADRMARTDLVVQCWTMGTATEEQIAGLVAAVRAGTGFAGWHGGIVDSFRASTPYLQMTGGQFAEHPGGFVEHEIEVVPERADHPIVAGIQRRWSQVTEQYWMLTDAGNDVLATTRFRATPETPWRQDVVSPAVWTRQWGLGRVFVSTIGHRPEDLDHQEVRTLTERGLLWASR
ncbi:MULTISPECIES: ThuA domain-containing protein [unclassified Micromonospora]|uniref:ThuA domain-containing protein n=1 Tax=unclassified Micromonospora TaxID=2617518 RepID=UPI000EF527B7|nr:MULTISPECIES: ThuA domain-containing protein [unclassified Micromonospora]RLP86399.1 ThuA domain-containing protein [Micromonospora sp. CV4]RLP93560.1 ThuA domain-containing protein [Micromonospora sp. BL4]